LIKTGFVGQYEHRLDDKNRVSLPAKHKKYIEMISSDPENAGEVMLRMGSHDCIEIFPIETWNKMVETFTQNTTFNGGNSPDEVRAKSRLSDQVSIDKSGRIMINSNLKAEAGINKKVVFLGVIDRIEIWAAEKLAEYDKGR